MGPPLCMRSVVDRNVVMRRTPVYDIAYFISLRLLVCYRSVNVLIGGYGKYKDISTILELSYTAVIKRVLLGYQQGNYTLI